MNEIKWSTLLICIAGDRTHVAYNVLLVHAQYRTVTK